ncbi:hypothetical protein CK623_00135 [Vandammella animalimorsus]|uniref:Replication-associated protein ORF2/G2P domain-containing protein n=1 Tax=Vandammella animalimorsus TaxID=2029117 RepID=A0A2A2AUM0_9BURK|nr:hypothetical protein [Vandammella animalimorsus]PAT41394.1 hypothetical protein CK623_00135 [Vandammella animalimorsus]
MQRIVTLPGGERKVFEGRVVADCWDVSIRMQNGHREVSARPHVQWVETDEKPWTTPAEYLAWVEQHMPHKYAERLAEFEQEQEERRLRNLERSAQRAKTTCRWLIKAQGLNELLTLTYRENQQDRALCKKHFKEFVRRMNRALGGKFVYVASFERQQRGAMHVHVACHKLPAHMQHKGAKVASWRVGTAIWRSIVGADNGLCFVGGKSRNGNRRGKSMSVAKLAQYVSKYILKDFEDAPAESNRYSRSDGLKAPKPERMTFQCSLAELIPLVFELGQGDVVVSHHVKGGAFPRYWLVTESRPG